VNYVAGDLVRVNDFLDMRHTCAVETMKQYCGKIAAILDRPLDWPDKENIYKLGFKDIFDGSWVGSGYVWEEAHFKPYKILRFYPTSAGIRFRITSSPAVPYPAGTTLELKL